MKFKQCPLCGSKKFVEETRDVARKIGNKRVSIPAVTYWKCVACKEKVYPASAIRKMEEFLKHKAA